MVDLIEYIGIAPPALFCICTVPGFSAGAPALAQGLSVQPCSFLFLPLCPSLKSGEVSASDVHDISLGASGYHSLVTFQFRIWGPQPALWQGREAVEAFYTTLPPRIAG